MLPPIEPPSNGGHPATENRNSQPLQGGSTEKPTTGILCRHLGLPSDSDTHYSFPSVGNHCHRNNPPASINFLYQQTYCLNEKHRICPVYQKSWNGRLPDGLSAPASTRKAGNRSLWLLILVILLLALAVAGYPFIGRLLSIPSSDHAHAGTESEAASLVVITSSPTPVAATLPVVITEDVIHLPLPTFTHTPRPTLTLSPTHTPTPLPPTPGPLLETPFGSLDVYLIHQVRPGESLGVIATRYGVPPQVIQAANPKPAGMTFWAGDLIAIPLSATDPAQVSPLQVIYLEQASTVSDLAEIYQQTPDLIRQLNALGPGETILAGRYLILPV